ncbi:MAG TPA: chemotaxis protein CheX, partial [Gammaproteobacteria bacterium]|nr:chemotaxis protein CheX [Gammaproteobacteria bacterium]
MRAAAGNDVILEELELDALTELVNLGVSRAAANLAVMVQEEVLLTVPKVELLTRDAAIRTLGEREARSLVAVHQTFEGAIVGRALLIFPEANSLELVRAIVGSELSNEDIVELEQEALAETGNIILNSCLATIA